MPVQFDAMSIPKEKVLRAQILTLAVVVYALVDLFSVLGFKDYLFYDGILVLVFLFFMPLGLVLAVHAIYIRKVFKPYPRRGKKTGEPRSGPRLEPDDLSTGLAAMFFPPGAMMLVASRDLRPELAKLHGDLLAGTEAETLPMINQYLKREQPAYLGACGDVISKNLVKTDFLPDIIVVDGRTQRRGYEVAFPQGYKYREVENVTGGITRAAWETIEQVIASGTRTIIEVIGGEEDLLLIPMVLLAPDNAIMAYGQPPVTDINPPIPSGAVMVKITPAVRRAFADLFSRFKPPSSTQ
ncbi:MAG: DUF359 domain-containing protein [Candidatus Lokiarchaeota archaeon]|nr:DUF359 domain-containing protein [Candidatus Lokiarchaeota archaeon]